VAVLDFLRQLRGVNTPYLGAYTTAEIATINAAIASGGYAPALGSHCVNSDTGVTFTLRGTGTGGILVDGDGNLSAYVDFTTKTNGAPPSFLDTGQVADYTFNATGRTPIINSGRLIVNNQAGAGSGGLADYYQSQQSGPVGRVVCSWTMPAGSDDGNGNTTYAAWDGIYEGGGTNVPKSWLHMSVIPGTGATGQAKWFVCNGIGNLFVVKTQNFTNPAADGVTHGFAIPYWMPHQALLTQRCLMDRK